MSDTTSTATQRQDVELQVLALILDNPQLLREIESSRFSPELFTDFRFKIANAIYQIIESEYIPEFTVVAIELEKTYGVVFDAWGGRQKLRELVSHVPYGDYSFRHLISILEDALRRRRLIDIARSAETLANDPTSNSKEVILESQDHLVAALAETNISQSFVSVEEARDGLIDQIMLRAQTPDGKLVGLSTGFRDIDYFLKGLQPGKMYTLAARPGAGKSSFALNVAAHTAIDQRLPVVFFSLEMGARELTERLISARAGVPFVHIADGKLSENDWANIARANKALLEAPLFMEESPSIGIADIRSRCQTIESAYGQIGLIVIDYLQLMSGGGRGGRQEFVSDTSRGIKILSKDFNTPVLALSQLNRKLEERLNKRPILSDLRESGSIEQDSDVVLFLYRDDTYYTNSSQQGICEAIIAKNRSGASGTAWLGFMNQFVRFETLAKV